MNVEILLDDYILNLSKNLKEGKLNISVFPSFIVYVLSLISASLAYAIIFQLDFFSWFSLFITNFISSIVVLLLFIVWVSFIIAIFKKNNAIDKFISLIFSSHSTYLLLLPLSLICLNFKLEYIFSFFQFLVILVVIKRILNYSRVYFNFNNFHMFFLVGLPILFSMFLMFLPIAILFYYFFYGKM